MGKPRHLRWDLLQAWGVCCVIWGGLRGARLRSGLDAIGNQGKAMMGRPNNSSPEDGQDGARAVTAFFKKRSHASQEGGCGVHFVVGTASRFCLCAGMASLWGLVAALIHRGHGLAWSEVGEPWHCLCPTGECLLSPSPVTSGPAAGSSAPPRLPA